MSTKKAQQEAEKAEALAKLRDLLQAGDTVFTLERYRSVSGVKHCISLFIFRPRIDTGERNPEPHCLDYLASRVLDMRRDNRHGGLVAHGGGTDMSFEIVYNLGRVLFPDGLDGRDGGYALRHWSLQS